MQYTVKKVFPQDIPLLCRIFKDSVLNIASKDYSREQTDAWAGTGTVKRWKELFASGLCFAVAFDNDGIMCGFTSVNTAGYLHSMFVGSGYRGKGVASELLKWAENYAKEHRAYEMSCDVSITAKTFFSKNGYRTEKEQSVRVKDIFMTNYAMKKKL